MATLVEIPFAPRPQQRAIHAALEKRGRALPLVVHRFGCHEAATPADVGWAARMIDVLGLWFGKDAGTPQEGATR